jgi:purine-binding chemotaxis protein CheW
MAMIEQKFVVFRLGEEWYGVPIERVERILDDQKVTKLPKLPELFMGVFDLRGETIPALDLRERFSMDPTESASTMVIVQLDTGRCAWRVDGVAGIFSLGEDHIEESPQLMRAKQDDFLKGVGRHNDRLIVLLEPDNVLPQAERGFLAAAA